MTKTLSPKNAAMALAFVAAASGKRLDGRKLMGRGINRAVRDLTDGEVQRVK